MEYRPEPNGNLPANAKKKFVFCRGCNVGPRRKLWLRYDNLVKEAKKAGKPPKVYLHFMREDVNSRNETLKVMIGGLAYGVIGYLGNSDTEGVMMLLRQGARFSLEVADFNRIGDESIPLVMNYVIEAKPLDTAPADAEPAAQKVEKPGEPEIKDFACKVPFARVEEISPERAKEMLEHNTKNRKLNMLQVSAIASTIENGHYEFTSQSIGFDTNGTLTDGQHRLHAIIKAGKTVPMVVVYGANQSVFTDRGKKRTVSENLSICYDDEFNSRVVSMINHAYRIVTGRHDCMNEVKMYMAYNRVRKYVENPALAATFNSPKAMYGSFYGSALLTLLLCGKYEVKDIEDMNSMFLNGRHSEGYEVRSQDAMVIEVRDLILTGRKPFIRKKFSNDIGLEEEKTMMCLRVMLPYLNGLKTKKSAEAAKKFFVESFGPVLDGVNEEYLEEAANQ